MKTAMVGGLACVFAVNIAAAPITVIDDFDRPVTLPASAQRIVGLAPHIVENLFAAGAGDKVVGVVERSDYPPAARRIGSVGSSARVNLEAVIALAPDLVVAWETAANREAVRALIRFGFAVYYSEPRGFDDIIENIEELALLAGSGAHISPSAARLRAELTQVRARYAAAATQRVFYQVWSAPLITLNGEHLVSRALEVCGARNVFAHLPIIAPRVGVEAVLQANPDIIISGLVDGTAPDMSMWDKWVSMRAVARGAFVFVDSDVMHRHTARMILGLRGLCAQIDGERGGGGEAEAGFQLAPE